MSKEQSALFNHHGRHVGGGGGWWGGWRRKPPVIGWSLQKEEHAGRAAGELRRLPGSHVSGAPVHLDAKCKVASRQF